MMKEDKIEEKLNFLKLCKKKVAFNGLLSADIIYSADVKTRKKVKEECDLDLPKDRWAKIYRMTNENKRN